uniref:exodeoxyribonuclease III n=1 Tax=Sus scrofa TaxID=9823 RepID=A0A8D1NN78_PIG
MAINTYLSIITLNVNGLNAPIKRHRVADWIKRQKNTMCCLQETHLRAKDTYRLKVKGWEKIFHANGQDRKAGVAILILDKINFKMKAIKKDKEGHYLMVKESIQEEDITIINIYAPNIGAPRYLQQILRDLKG